MNAIDLSALQDELQALGASLGKAIRWDNGHWCVSVVSNLFPGVGGLGVEDDLTKAMAAAIRDYRNTMADYLIAERRRRQHCEMRRTVRL